MALPFPCSPQGAFSAPPEVRNKLESLGMIIPDSLEVELSFQQVVGPGQPKQTTLSFKVHSYMWKAGKLRHDEAQTVELSDSEDDGSEPLLDVGHTVSSTHPETILDSDTLRPAVTQSSQATLILRSSEELEWINATEGDS